MKSPSLKLLLAALALIACARPPRLLARTSPLPLPAASSEQTSAAALDSPNGQQQKQVQQEEQPQPQQLPWLRVRSENFHVIGHAPEAELRRLTARLEEFHAVLKLVLGAEHFQADAPVVFVVFRDDEEYRPFKPLGADGRPDEGVAGYFLPGPQINYITFAAGGGRDGRLTEVAFHEYVHLLTRQGRGRVPLWLAEGLSEYYSSYALSDGGRRVRLGPALKRRAARLRAADELLPLGVLLDVDHDSPHYNDQARRGIFYAQSWALVHQILGGPLRRGLGPYLELVASGAAPAESFERAFGSSVASVDAALRQYVRAGRYRERSELLGARPAFNPTASAETLCEADVLAALGDLLMRAERDEEAGAQLRAALARDPDHPAARLSSGVLALRGNRLEEAREHLTRAVASDPRSHLARYHFAEALLRSATDADSTVVGFNEKTRLVREELKRAIELAPDFADAYALLAHVEIERGPDLESAAALIRRGQLLAPRHREFDLLAAQARMRAGEFDAARASLRALLSERALAPALRSEAQSALGTLAVMEAGVARARADASLAPPAQPPPLQPCDMPEPGPQRKALRFAGQQVCGRLVRIDCEDGAGVVLTVTAYGRTLRLRNDALSRIRFVTYTQSVSGRVECGPRAETVLVTYRNAGGGVTGAADGIVTAVEFLPDGPNR